MIYYGRHWRSRHFEDLQVEEEEDEEEEEIVTRLRKRSVDEVYIYPILSKMDF